MVTSFGFAGKQQNALIIMNEFKTIEKCTVPPSQATKLEACVTRDFPEEAKKCPYFLRYTFYVVYCN